MTGRTRISLYGEDTERFDRVREHVADERLGSEPSNAELVRVLLDVYEEERMRVPTLSQ